VSNKTVFAGYLRRYVLLCKPQNNLQIFLPDVKTSMAFNAKEKSESPSDSGKIFYDYPQSYHQIFWQPYQATRFFLLPTEKYSGKYLVVIIKMITFAAHL